MLQVPKDKAKATPTKYRRESTMESSKETRNLSKSPDLKREKICGLQVISCGTYLGLIYVILTCILTTLTAVIVKKIVYIGSPQLALMRFIGLLVCSLPIPVYVGTNILGSKKHRLLLLTTSFLGATALYLYFVAYRYLPIGEAIVIISTTPVMVVIGAKLFLKESIGTVITCTLVLTFIGISLSVRLPELIINGDRDRFTAEYIAGMAAAIISVFFVACYYILMRKLKGAHHSVITLYSSFVGIVESCLIIPVFSSFEVAQCGWDSFMILCVAILGFLGQTFITLAIQSEAVGIITIVRFSLNIVFGILFQVIFFRDYPDVYIYCGAALVIIGVTTIGLKKFVQTLPDGSNWRRKLRFMLL